MNALSMLIICMMVGAFLTLIAPSLWVFISGIVLLSVAIFLCSFHRISLGQFTESKRKRTGDIVLSALLLLWRCSNGVFKRVSFLLAGMECYCGIMSDDAGDRIIYLPVYFRKI